MNIYKQNQKTLVYSDKEDDFTAGKYRNQLLRTLNKITKYPLTITVRNLSKINYYYLSTLSSPLDKRNHGNFYNIHSSKIQIKLL